MATTTKQQNSFDFNAYNVLMNTAGTGLRLVLAKNLLQDAGSTMARFRNPLAMETLELCDHIEDIRNKNKILAAKAIQALGDVDNAHIDTRASNSGDTLPDATM